MDRPPPPEPNDDDTSDGGPYGRGPPAGRHASSLLQSPIGRRLHLCVWSLGFVKGETEYEAGFAEEAVFPLHHHCLMAWMLEAG